MDLIIALPILLCNQIQRTHLSECKPFLILKNIIRGFSLWNDSVLDSLKIFILKKSFKLSRLWKYYQDNNIELLIKTSKDDKNLSFYL